MGYKGARYCDHKHANHSMMAAGVVICSLLIVVASQATAQTSVQTIRVTSKVFSYFITELTLLLYCSSAAVKMLRRDLPTNPVSQPDTSRTRSVLFTVHSR